MGDAREGEEQAAESKFSLVRPLQEEVSRLKEALNADAPRCSPEALLSTIQRRMEAIVLNEESGSMSQQIKAEFIQELAGQVEAMCKAP